MGCSHFHSKDSCSDVKSCLELASQLTSKKYLYPGKQLTGDIVTVGKVVWTKDNADFLIGEFLSQNGYFRLKTPTPDLYYVLDARDVRYSSNIPIYTATKESNNEFPPANSADLMELQYSSKNGYKRTADIARNIRPFPSRYGRAIDARSSGTLIVRENVANVHQLLPMIRKFDVPETKSEKDEYERYFKLETLREKTRQEWMEKIKEHTKSKEQKGN